MLKLRLEWVLDVVRLLGVGGGVGDGVGVFVGFGVGVDIRLAICNEYCYEVGELVDVVVVDSF